MAYPNRYMCSALEEMRTILTKLDIHSIDRYKSLMAIMIEEVQTMGNRMEASLEDKGDVRKLTEKRAKLRREVEKLKAEVRLLKDEPVTGGDGNASVSRTIRNLVDELEE